MYVHPLILSLMYPVGASNWLRAHQIMLILGTQIALAAIPVDRNLRPTKVELVAGLVQGLFKHRAQAVAITSLVLGVRANTVGYACSKISRCSWRQFAFVGERQ